MNQVLLTSLLLEYPTSSTIKVQKIMSLAENLFGIDSVGYYDYIDEYTQPSEKKIANIILESMALSESGTKEYMGVTVYREDNGKYSVPELGIYNITGSSNLKDFIRDKLSRNKNVSFKEEIDTVFDNISYISKLSENQLLNFILNEMTEIDYKELGGTNFKNFVLVVSEVVNDDWQVPQSLIQENYIFDEGIGDFIKNVKGKVSDAHLELAYRAPGVASALGDAYSRHTAATKGVKSKLADIGSRVNSTTAALGDAYGRHTAATQAAGKKISDAKEKAGRIYNKVDKILSPAPRSRQDTAAVRGKIGNIYNAADKVLSPPPMSADNKDALKQRASNVGGILNRMILSPRPSNAAPKPAAAAPTMTNRSNVPERGRIANNILDKLKTDGDAEKAENKVVVRYKARKMNAAEREAALEKKYDEVMKEDLDIQLEYIKAWLYENEIFDNLEDIDNYMLEDMTGEEYLTIISEMSDEDGDHDEELKSLVKVAKSAKLKKPGRKATPEERRNVADTNTALDTATKFGTRYPNNHIDSTAGKPRKFMTIAQKMDAKIDSGIYKLAKNNKDDNPYYGDDIHGSVTPAKPLDVKKSTPTKLLGKAIAPPTSAQRGTAVVPYKNKFGVNPTSKSYDTAPKTYADRPSDTSYRSPEPSKITGSTAKPLGRALGNADLITKNNAHRNAMKNAVLGLNEPAAKKNAYDRLGSYENIGYPRNLLSDRPKPLGKAIAGNQHSLIAAAPHKNIPKNERFSTNATDNAIERMSIRGGDFADISGKNHDPKRPHVRGQVTDRNGNITYTGNGQALADSLKNSLGKNKVTPSSLISTISKKGKSIAKNVVGKIKSKLFGEEFAESDIKNFITEEEFLEITEWLVENDVFEDEEELEYFLMEELNWEYLDQIHSDIEDKAIELIIESLYDEEIGEYTYLVLESIIGDEIDILIEEATTMVASDVNQSPMPIKVVDCSCGKSSCKSCSKKSWKAKVYEKMNGGV